jgi:hypothetical protein
MIYRLSIVVNRDLIYDMSCGWAGDASNESSRHAYMHQMPDLRLFAKIETWGSAYLVPAQDGGGSRAGDAWVASEVTLPFKLVLCIGTAGARYSM